MAAVSCGCDLWHRAVRTGNNKKNEYKQNAKDQHFQNHFDVKYICVENLQVTNTISSVHYYAMSNFMIHAGQLTSLR